METLINGVDDEALRDAYDELVGAVRGALGVKHVRRGTVIDWARVVIVIAMLCVVGARNIATKLYFPVGLGRAK